MTDTQKLEPCPFCGGEMMERQALWPSDGDTDAIIHAQPTDCGLCTFDIAKADEMRSTRAAWNRRASPWRPIAEGRDVMDPEGLARWREIASSGSGHDLVKINHNSLRRILKLIPASPQEPSHDGNG